MLLENIKQLPIFDIFIHPKDYSFSYLITLISLAIMIFEPNSSDWLRYQAIEVNDGQYWRIISANLCHSNWNHWLLNIAGLWLMDIFYSPVISLQKRTYLLSFCMISSVAMMHFFMDVHWYVGLSGALHGYLIGGALLSWNKAKRLNFAIVLLTIIKLVVESFWQVNTSTESLIGVNVLEEAHSFGALSAVIFCLGYYLLNRIQKNTPLN